jgi:hypothetical protein
MQDRLLAEDQSSRVPRFVKNNFVEMRKLSRLKRGRRSLRRLGSRRLHLTRPDTDESIFPTEIFRNEMAFGIGRHELAVEIRWDIEKSINSSPNELDFEGMEAPTVSDARDVGGHDRLAFDARDNRFFRLRARDARHEQEKGKQNGVAQRFHPRASLYQTVTAASSRKSTEREAPTGF